MFSAEGIKRFSPAVLTYCLCYNCLAESEPGLSALCAPEHQITHCCANQANRITIAQNFPRFFLS
jgi:hypothetical protein